MSADADPQIPNRYHFVWFGQSFPAANRVAIESCLSCCQGAEVILWHSDDLSPREDFRALTRSGLIAKRLLFHALASTRGPGRGAVALPLGPCALACE